MLHTLKKLRQYWCIFNSKNSNQKKKRCERVPVALSLYPHIFYNQLENCFKVDIFCHVGKK